MSCLSPNIIALFPRETYSGEDKNHVLFLGNKKGLTFDTDIYRRDYMIAHPMCTDVFEVPCGKCIECQKQRAKTWGQRLILERTLHPASTTYFLTITYDDEHLPCGEDVRFKSLVPDDLTKFMKDLREHLRDHYGYTGLRFFAAGEYGDLSARPHYHLILYGFDFLNYGDVRLISRSDSGDLLFNNSIFDSCWKNGFAVFAEASPETMFYTARYCTKKIVDDKTDFYKSIGIAPPFTRMSRRPGIACEYYRKHVPELLNFGGYHVPGTGNFVPIERYGLKLLGEDFPDITEVLKVNQAYKCDLAKDTLSHFIDVNLDEYNRRRSVIAQKKEKVRENF